MVVSWWIVAFLPGEVLFENDLCVWRFTSHRVGSDKLTCQPENLPHNLIILDYC